MTEHSSNDEQTRTVHRRIELMAAKLMDAVKIIQADPSAEQFLQAAYERSVEDEAANFPTLQAIAQDTGNEIEQLERGPHITLTWTTVLDVIFSTEREPFTKCEHWDDDDAPERQWMFLGATRDFCCGGCYHKIIDETPDLSADTECEVCGADHGIVRAHYTTTVWGALTLIHTGPCCDELFSYNQPMRSKVPRNEPCPCHSGRKFKHCCGSSR